MRIQASTGVVLFRSVGATPSSRFLSNRSFICRLGAGTGNLRDFIAFLPNDSNIALGVCGSGQTYQ